MDKYEDNAPVILPSLLFVSYSEALKTELGPVEISVPYFLALAGLAFMLIGRLKVECRFASGS